MKTFKIFYNGCMEIDAEDYNSALEKVYNRLKENLNSFEFEIEGDLR